jgi:hypothetical protein
LAALAAPTASPHSSPCHPQHRCPSDHHSYAYNGLDCTSKPRERLANDTIVVHAEGVTFHCHRAGGSGGGRRAPRTPPPPRGRNADCNYSGGGRLPDPRCTPGATFAVGPPQICRAGYSPRVRNVPSAVKRRVFRDYGIARHPRGAYEVDHLIPLELGGSNAIANLWPQPAGTSPGFHEKDQLENELHARVCSGRLSLAQAQHEIASDWVAIYRRTLG